MTCDEAVRAIEAMLDREIDDDERMQLEAHLAGCESCRRETEERRAFSDRIGRDLNEALRLAPGGTRRIVIRPRRFPWVRAAAVIVVGIAIGYAGSAGGLFRAATAEAREVANLSALKDAYTDRDQELVAKLEMEAADLDRRAGRAPESAARDLTSLAVMQAAQGLAAAEPMVLPPEPEMRARHVARQLSSPSLSQRGRAVNAMRNLPAGDAVHLERQIGHLNGTNRTFTELVVLASRAPSEKPAVDQTIETNKGSLRFVQYPDARVRFEALGTSPTQVYQAVNVAGFRTVHPEVAKKIGLKGVDGDFTVYGVHHKAPVVDSRPTVYVPVVMLDVPAAESAGMVEVMSAQAVMVDYARAGRSLDETERKGREVLRRVHATASASPTAVRADPARVRHHLSDCRALDAARLALARESLRDELAALEKRVAELERRLECLRKAAITLEYLPR